MFQWIFSNSSPLNLLLAQSHQAEIIIVNRLTQRRNNETRVRVEPRSCGQCRRKSDAFTLSATLPIFFKLVLKITFVSKSRKIAIFPKNQFFSHRGKNVSLVQTYIRNVAVHPEYSRTIRCELVASAGRQTDAFHISRSKIHNPLKRYQQLGSNKVINITNYF